MELVDLKGPWFGSILLTLSVVLYQFQVLRKRRNPYKAERSLLQQDKLRFHPVSFNITG